MGGRSFGRLLVFGALVGASREAMAQATLLVESYAEARPTDADHVLAPLRERLQHRGVVTTTTEIAALLGGRLPMAPSEPGLSAAELTERIDLGFRSALRGDYHLAISQLAAALETAHENAPLIASTSSSRAWLTKALAGLAFARGRLGDQAGAAAAMAEQIRSFPDWPVTREAFGPEAEKLYTATRRALEAAPRGSLRVQVDAPDVQIYLDEVHRGRGHALAEDLLPGTYRIQLEAAGTSRRYTTTLHAGEQALLSIDWDTDTRVTATPQWVGFAWPHGAKPRTRQLVQRLARRGAIEAVIVVGIAEAGERRYVVGRRYRATGAIERLAWLEFGVGGPAQLIALADYLAGATRASATIRLGDPPVAGHALGSRAPAWAAGGVAAAAAAGGAYLLYLDGRSTCGSLPIEQCARLHDTALLGWTLLGGSVAAVAFGAYWYTSRAHPRAPAVVLGRSGAHRFAALTWSF